MVAEHFRFTVNPEGYFPKDGLQALFRQDLIALTDGFSYSQFLRTWDSYVRSLASGDSFLVIQDPWDRRREIVVSIEITMKALVLGGFP